MVNEKINKIIEEIRTKENLTKAELGEELGFSNFHIFRIYNGNTKPSIKFLTNLDEKYKLSKENYDFFRDEIEKINPKKSLLIEFFFKLSKETGETFSEISKKLGEEYNFISEEINSGKFKLTYELLKKLKKIYNISNEDLAILIKEKEEKTIVFDFNKQKKDLYKITLFKFLSQIEEMDSEKIKEIQKVLEEEGEKNENGNK